MATKLSSIRSQARFYLKEPVARFWTEAELLDIIVKGVNDMWGALIDLNQEHFLTISPDVTIAADAVQMTGLPADVFRVHLIEPLDPSDGATNANVKFLPRDYNSDEAILARQQTAQDPTGPVIIYYSITGAGSPVAAPTIYTQPKLTDTMSVKFAYIPGVGPLTADSNNPIPGESDHALIAWCVAFARAKEREDRSPDPNWISVYATEKQSILTRSAPRQSQEPIVVPDLFRWE